MDTSFSLQPTCFTIEPQGHRLTQVALCPWPGSDRRAWILTRPDQQQVFDKSSGLWRDESCAIPTKATCSKWKQRWTFDSAEQALAAYSAYRQRRDQEKEFGVVAEGGKTRLHLLATNPQEVAEIHGWAKAGGPIDPLTDQQDSPLHFAAWQKNKVSCLALLEHGANPNLKNHRGQTPFHHAVNAGASDIISAMISHGADWDISDNLGHRPLDLFVRRKTQGVRRSAVLPDELAVLLGQEAPMEQLTPSLLSLMRAEHGQDFTDIVQRLSISRLEKTLLNAITETTTLKKAKAKPRI